MRTLPCGFMAALVQEQCQLFQAARTTTSNSRTSSQRQGFGKVSNHRSISAEVSATQTSTTHRRVCHLNTSSKTLEMDPLAGPKTNRLSRPSSYGKTVTNFFLYIIYEWMNQSTNEITSWFFQGVASLVRFRKWGPNQKKGTHSGWGVKIIYG